MINFTLPYNYVKIIDLGQPAPSSQAESVEKFCFWEIFFCSINDSTSISVSL